MGSGPKIRASAARAHTRKAEKSSAAKRAAGGLGLLIFSACFALASWVLYANIIPPPPKICGTPNGPPVTASRVVLRDGRYLAYKETGVPKEKAKFKLITVHGYGGSRHALLGSISQNLVKELGIYIVGFDRAGYGQSTPNLDRTIKSDVLDVQDLADNLDLGSTFYVSVTSIGSFTGYGLIKYLPHRLAGLVMFAPVVNFWWPSFSKPIMNKAFADQAIGDRLALRVAHHAPWLVYWYMTQTWLPTSSTVRIEHSRLDEADMIRMTEFFKEVHAENLLEPTQQGKDESQFRDMRIMFGKWEFEPFDLENPFAGRKGAVHIWQGDLDYLVPPELQREVSRRIPWIHYHEVEGAGHGLLSHPGQADIMIRNFFGKD